MQALGGCSLTYQKKSKAQLGNGTGEGMVGRDARPNPRDAGATRHHFALPAGNSTQVVDFPHLSWECHPESGPLGAASRKGAGFLPFQ